VGEQARDRAAEQVARAVGRWAAGEPLVAEDRRASWASGRHDGHQPVGVGGERWIAHVVHWSRRCAASSIALLMQNGHRRWQLAGGARRRRNAQADAASRQGHSPHEWRLSPALFRQLNTRFGPFTVDLFATSMNKQPGAPSTRGAGRGDARCGSLRCGAARTAVASRVQHGAERHSLGRRRGKGMRRYSGGSPALDGLHAAPARGVQGVVVAGVGVGCHRLIGVAYGDADLLRPYHFWCLWRPPQEMNARSLPRPPTFGRMW